MNILVANDDGIMAEGLLELVKALGKEANVYVVAPHDERSGAGQSIAMGKKLYFEQCHVPGAKKAYSFTGTPTDCVKMGLMLYRQQGIEMDLVYAGINHGGNLGTDTLYSGTVGAAREGLVNEKISVAISVASHSPIGFEYACKMAVKTYRNIKEKFEEMRPVLVNINVPNIPPEEIKGVQITRLGVRDYDKWFQPVELEDGRIEVYYGGTPIGWDDPRSKAEGISDVIAVAENYVSVTPLGYDLTDVDGLKDDLWGIYK